MHMKKLLLLMMAVLLCVRLSAQTADTTETQTPEVPTIMLLDSEFDESSTSVNEASTLLTSSRDVFNSIAAYNFGSFRYRIRGNDSKYSEVMINGILMNDPETGRPVFSNWGGLNDAFRNSVIVDGLGRTDASFGALGGLTSYSTRASEYRKQISLSYAFSNRSYNHRLMASIGTGEIGNGWYLMAAGSGRYSGKGYTEGTFYEAASYFLSVEKKINDKHSLDLTVFGAPSQRGGSSPVVQEAYDLVGSNYYNPNWGYQTLPNGKQVKRNSRVSRYHQPMAQLTWYWKPSLKTKVTTTAFFFAGPGGQSALEWGEAADPRPDYYKNLPSYMLTHATSAAEYEAVVKAWEDRDPSVTQIDWDALYAANMNHGATVQNANGTGQTVTGLASKYIVAARHYDKRQMGGSTFFKHDFLPNLFMTGGLQLNASRTHYYEEVEDLLGGDFYLDINKYAENLESDELQTDLNTPNHVAKVGDIINYNYYANRNYGRLWGQVDYLVGNFDMYLGLQMSFTQIWRTGLFESGAFPGELSAGDDKKHNFLDPGVKGGVTYAINGRNHLVLNGVYMHQAPQFRDIYVSPRTRHTLVSDNLGSERISGVDLSYMYRSPIFKFRLTGYYYTYRNLIWNRSFYCENVYTGVSEGNAYTSEYINFVMTGINQKNVGLEMGAEYNVTPTITLQAAAAHGVQVYTNNPTFSIYDDNNAKAYILDNTAYLKNYHVANGPGTVGSFGIKYNDPKNWWVSMNANYLANMYFDVNPYNHTEAGMSHYIEGDARIPGVLAQDPLASAFTLDFYGGISKRYKGYYFLLTASVNNILNNKSIVLYGYDQLRFNANDPDMFPSKYSYMYGTNFYISLIVRK